MKLFVRLAILVVLAFSFSATPTVTLIQEAEAAPPKKKKGGKYARKKANKKGLKWDIGMKKRFYDEQLATLRRKGVPIDKDKAMVKRIKRIVNRLKAKSLIPDLPYEVHLVSNGVVNAVCYPGGGILVFDGLYHPEKGLVNKKSDDELAAVLGHEIAHATLRHGYRSHKSRQVVGLLGTVASVAVGAAGGANWGKVFDVAFDVTTGLYFPSYSRKKETEADFEGVYTMLSAGGYDPQAAVDLWQRAAKKRGKKGDKTSIFASHPASGKRAKDLKKLLDYIEKQKK